MHEGILELNFDLELQGKNKQKNLSLIAGVGNDFFPGGSRGYWVLELRGVSGGGFMDPKFDQF